MSIGRIPENVLEEILSRVDIVEVISGYIPLKRAGRNFRAVCPFHHEKTPSFMVSADKQIYHCFGCHAGGNAFKFLMQYERLEFPEAVEVLARKAGVQLPEIQKQDAATSNLVTQLYKINESAALFYEQNLNSAEAKGAKDYLIKRGIKEQTLKLFKLGFALDKWDGLINNLRSKSISISMLEKAGLVLTKESGGYYDRFRNRIIFPIFDVKSRPLGFGARVLDNSVPKYINSPETPIYSKGKNLYGLNLSRDAIRDKDCVVIVEGYLDFIMPYQAGITNVVASLGTALTREQIRLLKRYTLNAVMIYDPDTAGQSATLRTLDMFVDEGMDVRVVSLSQGLDPDLYIRKNGIDKFRQKIEESQNLFDYKLGILRQRFNINEAEGKAKIASGILPTIRKFKNSIIKAEYIKRLSEVLNTEERHIIEELKKIKDEKTFLEPEWEARKKELNINPTEKLLIKLMLEDSDLIGRLKGNISPEDFQDERVSRIVSMIFDFAEKGKKIETSALINYFADEDLSYLICESAFLEVSSDNKENVIEDCMQRIKSEKLKFRKQCLHNRIREAQHSGNEEALNELMQEFHLLIKERG